jgi:hypothetical protein
MVLKKGQVTIFIILAVVIVVAVGSYLYYNKLSNEKEFFESSDIAPLVNNIQSFAFDCAEVVSGDALVVTGLQGGYYEKRGSNDNYVDADFVFIPYYYNEGEFLMPKTSVIESEIGKYVDDNIDACLESGEFDGFEISLGSSRTSVEITENDVRFKVDKTLRIKREGKTMKLELEKTPVVVNSKLFEILEIADYVTESHKEDPDMICISCVTDMALERDVFVDFLTFGDETETLVVISENVTSENAFVFEFLNKYPADVSE